MRNVPDDGPGPVLAKIAPQYPQGHFWSKDSGFSAPSQRCSSASYYGVGTSGFKDGGHVRKSTRIDRFRVVDAVRHDPIQMNGESVPNLGF